VTFDEEIDSSNAPERKLRYASQSEVADEESGEGLEARLRACVRQGHHRFSPSGRTPDFEQFGFVDETMLACAIDRDDCGTPRKTMDHLTESVDNVHLTDIWHTQQGLAVPDDGSV
jgi:hypothetical protein